MAIYDTMQFVGCDVATVCLGLAASMGQFLLTAGAPGKRYTLPNARIMMHQPLAGLRGQAADIAIQAEQHAYTKRRMAELIAQHSGKSLEQIQADSERDRWFTAEQAVEYGLCDEVKRSRHEIRDAPDGQPASPSGGAAPAAPAGADRRHLAEVDVAVGQQPVVDGDRRSLRRVGPADDPLHRLRIARLDRARRLVVEHERVPLLLRSPTAPTRRSGGTSRKSSISSASPGAVTIASVFACTSPQNRSASPAVVAAARRARQGDGDEEQPGTHRVESGTAPPRCPGTARQR